MKTYKLTFSNLATLSKIPDAQTIFGIICNVILQTKGEEELKKYLNSFNDKAYFVHSSMFYENALPMPKVSMLVAGKQNEAKWDVLKMQPNKQLSYLSKTKKYKKIAYIKESLFNEHIVTDKIDELRQRLLNGDLVVKEGCVCDKEDISNESYAMLNYHNNHLDQIDARRLYYDQTMYIPKNTKFVIYVKCEDIKYVKDIFKYSEYFGMGNRASVGKNMFKLLDTQLCEFETFKENCVLLSKCTFDEDFNVEQSSYMIEANVYRGSKYYSSNAIARINKYVEGSYMNVKHKKDYYGSVIKLNNNKDIYHYGIGFVL